MTIEQAYLQYLQLINRNATNNNTNVSKDRFVLTFNNVQNRYVEWVLEKRNEDDIRDIQVLLQKDVPLSLLGSEEKFQSYQLPNNYFDFANIRAKAKSDCCPADNIHLFEVKSEDVESLFVDTNNEPSFDWRESFYHFANNAVILYRKNFEYDKVYLTYYRYPQQVDIQGYFVGTTPSTNIDPEFDDKVVNRIILGMSKEFAAITSDTASYQMDKDRLFTF
jgi:hypothetical protein